MTNWSRYIRMQHHEDNFRISAETAGSRVSASTIRRRIRLNSRISVRGNLLTHLESASTLSPMDTTATKAAPTSF